MSLNRFMHPRNIYKIPPDFGQLAIAYEDFRNVSKMNVNGKVHIDFKDEQALRTLTQCLLKKDFNLDILLPVNQLIPTLSLRLNYILWIEDIVRTFRLDSVAGVDIGCGASCIYPILAIRQNPNWKMYATELNRESIVCAQTNINRNGLSVKIELITECNEREPFEVLKESEKLHDIDFTMCNPPFFADECCSDDESALGVATKPQNRTGKRKAASNAKTGIRCELLTVGGEVAFVKKMVVQSRQLRYRIKVFTTMLGHKSSLNQIQSELANHAITNYCTTEFCQGRTTRWGIAWTFRNDLLLRIVPSTGQMEPKPPLKLRFDDEYDDNAVNHKLKSILQSLTRAKVTNCSSENECHQLQFVASTNSWSKQRQKRRAAIRNGQRVEENKSGSNDIEENDCASACKRLKPDESNTSQEKSNVPLDSETLDIYATPLLHVRAIVQKLSITALKPIVEINFEYLNGTAGWNGLHELLQFVKNKWKS